MQILGWSPRLWHIMCPGKCGYTASFAVARFCRCRGAMQTNVKCPLSILYMVLKNFWKQRGLVKQNQSDPSLEIARGLWVHLNFKWAANVTSLPLCPSTCDCPTCLRAAMPGPSGHSLTSQNDSELNHFCTAPQNKTSDPHLRTDRPLWAKSDQVAQHLSLNQMHVSLQAGFHATTLGLFKQDGSISRIPHRCIECWPTEGHHNFDPPTLSGIVNRKRAKGWHVCFFTKLLSYPTCTTRPHYVLMITLEVTRHTFSLQQS